MNRCVSAAGLRRVDELESIVERLEEECQRSTAESAAKLQECTVQLATSRLDGERLQVTDGRETVCVVDGLPNEPTIDYGGMYIFCITIVSVIV